jgi:hypothetical protein
MDGGTGVEDEHVLFPRDSATLTKADRETLDSLIAGTTDAVTIHVHGYASREGDADYNLNVSAHRAVAVKTYLESVLPAGSRVIAYAYGETTEFGRLAENRRVGIDVIETPGLLLPPLGALDLGAGGLTLSQPSLGLPSGAGLRFELDPDLRAALTPLPPITSPVPDPTAHIWSLPTIEMPRFDVGTLAPDYNLRGIPYSARDAHGYEQHFSHWYRIYVSAGMSEGTAAWLAQKGTEMAARTQLSLEAPTEQERFDRAWDTEPSTLPVLNDAVMRWLWERFR